MELMQLEMFVAMVEEGSFRRAADRVFRTQPAVTMAIRKLEQELGAPSGSLFITEISLAGSRTNPSTRRMSLDQFSPTLFLRCRGHSLRTPQTETRSPI